ncbi:hypothetical protein L9F63_026243, partial [Diploptera punctata]
SVLVITCLLIPLQNSYYTNKTITLSSAFSKVVFVTSHELREKECCSEVFRFQWSSTVAPTYRCSENNNTFSILSKDCYQEPCQARCDAACLYQSARQIIHETCQRGTVGKRQHYIKTCFIVPDTQFCGTMTLCNFIFDPDNRSILENMLLESCYNHDKTGVQVQYGSLYEFGGVRLSDTCPFLPR